MVHVSFDSFLEDLVGKKLGDFLGRSGFKGHSGPQDSGLDRKIADDNKNCLEDKNSSATK